VTEPSELTEEVPWPSVTAGRPTSTGMSITTRESEALLVERETVDDAAAGLDHR